MKRIIVIPLLILVLLFSSACTLTIGGGGITLEEDGKEIYSTNAKYRDTCPMIEKTLLYDGSDFTITALDMEYDTTWDVYAVNIEIANNSGKDVKYSIDSAKVNGFSMDAYASGEVYNECKDTFELGLSRSEIAFSSIVDVKEIVFDICIRSSDTKEELLDIPAFLKTEKYDGVNDAFEFDGVEIYNNDGISIFAKPNNKTDVDEPLILFIKNETDRMVSFGYKDVAYNGEMVMDWCSGTRLLPHSMKIFKMNLFFFDDIDVVELSRVDMKITILPIRLDGSVSTADQYETPRITIDNF